MVTAISHFRRLIRDRRIRPMQAWSTRCRGQDSSNQNPYFRKLKQEIRNLLNLISGFNIVEMLQGKLLFNIKLSKAEYALVHLCKKT